MVRITADFFSGRGSLLLALWFLCSLLPLSSRGAGEEPMQPLLRQLAAQERLEIAGATVYDLQVTQAFYERGDWAPAWTRPDAVAELAAAIERAWREGMNGQDYHQQQVQGLLDGSLILDVPARDLLLTDSLVRLTYHYALGKVDPRDYVASWNFDRELPDTDPVAWMGQVIAEGGIGSGLDRLRPTNPIYDKIVRALVHYRALAAAGGWGSIDGGPTL
jgi:murein L,D-transpeptidase YcbB/YkuD